MTKKDLQDYESLIEAAYRLGITPGLVRRWCREGKLPCLKVNERAWIVERNAEPDVRFRRSAENADD